MICPNNSDMPIDVDPHGFEDMNALNRKLRSIRKKIKKKIKLMEQKLL